MEQLKVTIKPKLEPSEGQCLNSAGYSIKINDLELGHGVVGFSLEFLAGSKPKATITFTPEVIDVDETVADVQSLLSELNK